MRRLIQHNGTDSIHLQPPLPLKPRVLELCAGAGGQALGLEWAGFANAACVEIDPDACLTLQRNRPNWQVYEEDLHTFDASNFRGVELVAAGVPCPPFSIAGKQLGADDERDLFPSALRIIEETLPKAVMFENVRGLATARFETYRADLFARLENLGYRAEGRILNASDFAVPQLRPRYIIVALRPDHWLHFNWPTPVEERVTVADAIVDLLAEDGWRGAQTLRKTAATVAPTIVGGSKKHGGPDLGPTRAKQRWAELGIDGMGIADSPPSRSHPENARPKLTVRMVARIQGFPDSWLFAGGKTSAYRQVGNAFPPPVAAAVGRSVMTALQIAQGAEDGRLRLFEQRADFEYAG